MSSSSTSITKNTVVMESDEHNNNNNNIVEFDHDENDNHGNYDDDDNDNDSHDHIPMEEHHDLVIQQSMSIGTDDDDDDDDDEHNHHDYYYSSDDGSRSYRTNHPNNNNNGSFLYHSTKFWNTEQNLDHHPQQHLYNYLESTEGFLLNGNSSSRRNENHIILNHPRSGHKKNNKNSRNSSSSISGWKCCVGTMLIFILLSIFAIVVPKKTRPTTRSSNNSDAASSSSSSSSFSNNNNNTIFTLPTIHKFKGAPQYSCPNVNNNNVNTNTMEDEAFNNRFGNRIDVNLIQQDIPEFVNTFRDRDIRQYMDIGWNNYSNSSPINVTYNTWKEQMTHWRTTKYIPSLKKTGANIFEVNCGLGLNLFMTYEIIHQSQPKDDIRDVHLYGSTTTTPTTRHFSHYYNDDSIRTAMTANVVLDTILQKEANFVGGGKRGMICPTTTTTTTTTTSSSSTTSNNNDQSNYHLSMELSFIPDNSFDLVYTSYVPPLREIWDTDTNRMTNEEFVQRHVELCRTKESDWKSSILYNISQQQHELLYGQYVSEMIRITKPGNVIAIEHVPIPFCDTVANINDIDGNTVSYYSGGGTGIAPSFWYSNHTYERYQWNDIDRTSIEMEMDASSALWWSADQNNNNYTHYHVVMKKIKR